jgi:hypothetical protein
VDFLKNEAKVSSSSQAMMASRRYSGYSLLELQLRGPKNACTAELSAVVVAVANRLSPPRRR